MGTSKSLTERLLQQRKDKEAGKDVPEPTKEELDALVAKELAEGNSNSGEVGAESSLAREAEKQMPTDQDQKATEQVAKDMGITEKPVLKSNVGSPLLGGVQTGMEVSHVPILQTPRDQTPEEIQATRSEVDTHILTVQEVPTGAGGFPLVQDPPQGTLPNSNLVYSDPDSVMGQADKMLSDGIAAGKVSDEENELAVRMLAGEQRRQRMLENRPTQEDLSLAQEEAEAPEGGYKASARFQQFVDNQGSWVRAENGYFVPKTDEHKAMLDYYVERGLLEAPKKAKKSKE